MTMIRTLIVAVALIASAAPALAQDKKVTAADFAGTWNIEVMSHQIALVIEPKEPASVTATMMMMGRDVPLKGDLVDRTLTLVGVPGETTEGGHVAARPAGQGGHPITVTLQDDGTIAGEMMTNQGPVKWTGEKLKTRKKG
jgi:hypothetical protein